MYQRTSWEKFPMHKNNLVEKNFLRKNFTDIAMNEFYFSKGSVVQNMIHELNTVEIRKRDNILGK